MSVENNAADEELIVLGEEDLGQPILDAEEIEDLVELDDPVPVSDEFADPSDVWVEEFCVEEAADDCCPFCDATWPRAANGEALNQRCPACGFPDSLDDALSKSSASTTAIASPETGDSDILDARDFVETDDSDVLDVRDFLETDDELESQDAASTGGSVAYRILGLIWLAVGLCIVLALLAGFSALVGAGELFRIQHRLQAWGLASVVAAIFITLGIQTMRGSRSAWRIGLSVTIFVITSIVLLTGTWLYALVPLIFVLAVYRLPKRRQLWKILDDASDPVLVTELRFYVSQRLAIGGWLAMGPLAYWLLVLNPDPATPESNIAVPSIGMVGALAALSVLAAICIWRRSNWMQLYLGITGCLAGLGILAGATSSFGFVLISVGAVTLYARANFMKLAVLRAENRGHAGRLP